MKSFIATLILIAIASLVLTFIVMLVGWMVLRMAVVVGTTFEEDPYPFYIALCVFLPVAFTVTLLAMLADRNERKEQEIAARREKEDAGRKEMRRLFEARQRGQLTDDQFYEGLHAIWTGEKR